MQKKSGKKKKGTLKEKLEKVNEEVANQAGKLGHKDPYVKRPEKA